jgi:hypothetical protein
MYEPAPVRVLALVPELLTSVRIESGVQRMGGFLDVAETPQEFFTRLREDPPALAIVDLSLEWLDLAAVVEAAALARVPLLAFGPHVDTRRLRQAREAGVDFVFPRSKFMADVTGTVREALSGARA